MDGIQRDIQKQKAVFLQVVTGIEHLATEKYRLVNNRVQRAVTCSLRSH